MGKIYLQVLEFKKKYPKTIGWRLKKNAAVVEMHLNSDEEALYSFVAQKNENIFDIFQTCVVTLTNKLTGKPEEKPGFHVSNTVFMIVSYLV